MNIVLIGFMGSGKTTIGKMLSQRLSKKFIDLDKEIERDTGCSISEIFKKNGEKYFRDVETKIVKLVSVLDNYVIATGGGVVIREENITELRKNGFIVYLRTEPETVFERLKNEKDRPLLNKKSNEEIMSEIKKLMTFREKFYLKNDFQLDTDNLSVDKIVDEIIEKVKNQT